MLLWLGPQVQALSRVLTGTLCVVSPTRSADAPLRVLVTGSRHWTDRATLFHALDSVGPDSICHGQCIYGGADSYADDWAVARHVPVERFPADWLPDGPDGPKDFYAGKRRNRLMLSQFRPALVLAFKDGFDWEFRRGGTEDMVKIAIRAGIPYRVIDLKPVGQLPLSF